MKKLLLFILLLIPILTFSQEIRFARAHTFTTGYRDYSTNEIVWNGTQTKCDILIKLEDNSITIYSAYPQSYHVVTKLNEIDLSVQYRVLDSKGQNCNFYMGPVENSDSIFMVIEYNDFSWMYFTTPED